MFFLTAFPQISIKGATQGLKTFAMCVLPSIFPFMVISKYNYADFPLSADAAQQSDGTAATVATSFGATVADFGSTLSDSYIKAMDKNAIRYLSDDKMIDASTCILPENTWFVKDMLHSTTHDGHDEFYRILHESEEQLTVFDMEEYPQFMQNDTVNQTFHEVLPLRGTHLQNVAAQTFQMPSFMSFMKLFVTFFEEFYHWMVG